jgi:hypothetical protein
VANHEFNEESGDLTIAGLSVNLPEAEEDTENIITISLSDDGPVLGPHGNRGFIADVDIPPRRYTIEEYEDENGQMATRQVAVPFDPERVLLRLWPLAIADNNELEV